LGQKSTEAPGNFKQGVRKKGRKNGRDYEGTGTRERRMGYSDCMTGGAKASTNLLTTGGQPGFLVPSSISSSSNGDMLRDRHS
jgi:hypothetical protein